MHDIALTVNGRRYERRIPPRLLLSDFIREQRVDDRLVAGAAAQIAGQLDPELSRRRVRVLLEQELRGHQDPRCTEAALQAEVLVERLLERVQRRAVRERLHGLDCGAVVLHGPH